jgi:hypothetical protein
VPAEYIEFLDVFSKKISDQPAPHRSYNYKIVLESENTLGFSPLYKISIEELETLKRYFIKNLDKEFIAPSQFLFAAPVLFIKKKNSSLRLYINFRKLNIFTRKN